MKNYEALLAIARIMKLCEGTKVKWFDCFKQSGGIPIHPGNVAYCLQNGDAEAAASIVGDKPVFVGHTLWNKGHQFTVLDKFNHGNRTDYLLAEKTTNCSTFFAPEDCSWNPPKKTTVMVETPINIANLNMQVPVCCLSVTSEEAQTYMRNCRKAIEDFHNDPSK